jgi:hypothetical protein
VSVFVHAGKCELMGIGMVMVATGLAARRSGSWEVTDLVSSRDYCFVFSPGRWVGAWN